MWSEPVGEGAKRVTTGLSDIRNRERGEGASDDAALLTPSRGRLHSAGEAFAAAIAAQADRWFLWAPVAFGGGCATYVGARAEPAWILALTPAICCFAAAVAARGRIRMRALVIAIMLAAFFACGFAAGKIRNALVAGPVVPPVGVVSVSGWVVDVDSPGATGQRIIVAPTSIGGLAPDALPRRIRVTLREAPSGPGSPVRFRALLNPPPQPAIPGGYEFARNAWFNGIGGSGVALTSPQMVSLPDPDWRLRLSMAVNSARWSLAQRIVAHMSSGSAGLGAAMITGHEAWIDEETETTLRDAGLAHIISISGLHMAIVGGFAFFLARVSIAAVPWLALRVPGKKVAACVGLAAVCSYLVLSGTPPPAERAAITASIAFGAILADRRAISLHALAIAALVVLAWQPEAVAEAGFQMSFAATAALVALAELWRRPPREINTPWPIRAVQNAGLWLGVALMASLVAGLATGPFAIQHFNRVAVFGLPANLLTEPLSSFVIMPFLALGALFETVGLGGPFLGVASFGIDLMNSAAAWFASREHATLLVSSAPVAALPVSFLGILWLCLMKGWLRWLGLPAAFAVCLWPRPEAPMAWIASDGATAVIRQGERAILLRPDTKLFGAEQWANHHGLAQDADGMAARDEAFDCSSQSCRPLYDSYPRLSIWWTARKPKPDVLDALCHGSDILVLKAKIAVPATCRDVKVLVAADFTTNGSAEVYADGRIVWSQPLRGDRPWTTLTGSGE